MTIRSSTEAANRAVEAFKRVEITPMHITVSNSDVASMQNGAEVANHVFQSAKFLNERVIDIADAIPAYAKKVKQDDLNDATKMDVSVSSSGLQPVF